MQLFVSHCIQIHTIGELTLIFDKSSHIINYFDILILYVPLCQIG